MRALDWCSDSQNSFVACGAFLSKYKRQCDHKISQKWTVSETSVDDFPATSLITENVWLNLLSKHFRFSDSCSSPGSSPCWSVTAWRCIQNWWSAYVLKLFCWVALTYWWIDTSKSFLRIIVLLRIPVIRCGVMCLIILLRAHQFCFVNSWLIWRILRHHRFVKHCDLCFELIPYFPRYNSQLSF